jgi:hypothetical protein
VPERRYLRVGRRRSEILSPFLEHDTGGGGGAFLGREEVGGPSGRPKGSYPQVEADFNRFPELTDCARSSASSLLTRGKRGRSTEPRTLRLRCGATSPAGEKTSKRAERRNRGCGRVYRRLHARGVAEGRPLGAQATEVTSLTPGSHLPSSIERPGVYRTQLGRVGWWRARFSRLTEPMSSFPLFPFYISYFLFFFFSFESQV